MPPTPDTALLIWSLAFTVAIVQRLAAWLAPFAQQPGDPADWEV